jgi:endonuclease-3
MKFGSRDIESMMDIFNEVYPSPKCELNYDTPFQLLIATVLAAQATDKKVNEVTKQLFKKYKAPADFLELAEDDLAKEIKSINFYRTKARNILSICRILVTEFNGQVPRNQEHLVKLPGVGRKTANVVLSNAFGVPAIAVDTHVHRVSNRLGLVDTSNVLDTELELQKIILKEQWSVAHNYLVLHGRYVCTAKKPKCEACKISYLCKNYN